MELLGGWSSTPEGLAPLQTARSGLLPLVSQTELSHRPQPLTSDSSKAASSYSRP